MLRGYNTSFWSLIRAKWWSYQLSPARFNFCRVKFPTVWTRDFVRYNYTRDVCRSQPISTWVRPKSESAAGEKSGFLKPLHVSKMNHNSKKNFKRGCFPGSVSNCFISNACLNFSWIRHLTDGPSAKMKWCTGGQHGKQVHPFHPSKFP